MGQADFAISNDTMLKIDSATMCILDLCPRRCDANVTYNIPFVEVRDETYGLKFNVSSDGSFVENTIEGSSWNCWTSNLTTHHDHVQEFNPLDPIAKADARNNFTFCYEPALNQYMTIADSISPYPQAPVSAIMLEFYINSSQHFEPYTLPQWTWYSVPGQRSPK